MSTTSKGFADLVEEEQRRRGLLIAEIISSAVAKKLSVDSYGGRQVVLRMAPPPEAKRKVRTAGSTRRYSVLHAPAEPSLAVTASTAALDGHIVSE